MFFIFSSSFFRHCLSQVEHQIAAFQSNGGTLNFDKEISLEHDDDFFKCFFLLLHCTTLYTHSKARFLTTIFHLQLQFVLPWPWEKRFQALFTDVQSSS